MHVTPLLVLAATMVASAQVTTQPQPPGNTPVLAAGAGREVGRHPLSSLTTWAQDESGKLFRRSDGGKTTEFLSAAFAGAEISSLKAAPVDTDVMLARVGNKLHISSDAGHQWEAIDLPFSTSGGNFSAHWEPGSVKVLLVGPGQVLRSNEKVTEWEAVYSANQVLRPETAMVTSSMLYIGTAAGSVIRFAPDGVAIESDRISGCTISSIASASPSDPGHFLVGCNLGLFETRSGFSFESVSGANRGLPVGGVTSVTSDFTNDAVEFSVDLVNGETYSSTDATTWATATPAGRSPKSSAEVSGEWKGKGCTVSPTKIVVNPAGEYFTVRVVCPSDVKHKGTVGKSIEWVSFDIMGHPACRHASGLCQDVGPYSGNRSYPMYASKNETGALREANFRIFEAKINITQDKWVPPPPKPPTPPNTPAPGPTPVPPSGVAIEAFSADGRIGDTVPLTARVAISGRGVQGYKVDFFMAGSITRIGSATTDTAGFALILYKIPQGAGIGTRQFVARTGDKDATASLSVTQAPTRIGITKSQFQTMTFTLTRATDGAGLEGATLAYQLSNGVTGTAITRNNGSVTVNAGTAQSATVSFAGDKNYLASSATLLPLQTKSGSYANSMDLDGDGRPERILRDQKAGAWRILFSKTNEQRVVRHGGADAYGMLGDVNADGVVDFVCRERNSGEWSVRYGSATISDDASKDVTFSWGGKDDLPVLGDYDQLPGLDFAAVTRNTGVFSVRPGTNTENDPARNFGVTVGGPITYVLSADLNLDGKSEFIVYSHNSGLFTVLPSNGEPRYQIAWGNFGPIDRPVIGWWSGSPTPDLAVYHGSLPGGPWSIRAGSQLTIPPGKSSFGINWGGHAGTLPVAALEPGSNGRADLEAYSPSVGVTSVNPAANLASPGSVSPYGVTFGGPNDVPVAPWPMMQ